LKCGAEGKWREKYVIVMRWFFNIEDVSKQMILITIKSLGITAH
jgi:hypothetical protein